MRIRRARVGLVAIVLFAAALAGCAGMNGTPFNPAQSCQAVGGIYEASGRCNMVLP